MVTVSEKDEAQAFKITITEEPHFNIIKSDKRSRVKDTAITAEALLPDWPYNLWRRGETSRRVKDLAGAFAQLPHLPKMLKASAILDTLVAGCDRGTFVLRLTRPDGTFRTWWMSRPDENALNAPVLELVLPKSVELGEIPPDLLAPKRLPSLWQTDEISVNAVMDYFSGSTVVQVQREGYQEPMQIPKASQAAVDKAVGAAVENGALWLLAGPASILREPIPAGVVNASAKLCAPPARILAPEILLKNLPGAWKDDGASALSIAMALSVKVAKTLPWTTVRNVITDALQARFLELAEGSQACPCDFPSAQLVKLKPSASAPQGGDGGAGERGKALVAHANLEPSQVQELGDIMGKLLEIKVKAKTPVRFEVRIEMGDGKTPPPAEAVKEANDLLKRVKEGLQLR